MAMTDREKVLHGLNSCLEGVCDLCDYHGSDAPGGCKDELMLDALNVIKAQQPRVLTLDEAKEALRNDPVICIEGDGKLIYGVRMDGTDYFMMQTGEVMNINDLDNEEFAAGYGTVFRMWKR